MGKKLLTIFVRQLILIFYPDKFSASRIFAKLINFSKPEIFNVYSLKEIIENSSDFIISSDFLIFKNQREKMAQPNLLTIHFFNAGDIHLENSFVYSFSVLEIFWKNPNLRLNLKNKIDQSSILSCFCLLLLCIPFIEVFCSLL